MTDDPIIHLYQYEEHLQNGVGAAKYFLDKVDEFGVDELTRSCGADVTPIVEGIGILHNNLELLLDALRYVFDSKSSLFLHTEFSQMNLLPIYHLGRPFRWQAVQLFAQY